MRRPARTRRLTIAAIVSLLAFGVVAAFGVRSFWNCDVWHAMNNKGGRAFVLAYGGAGFTVVSGATHPRAIPFVPSGHTRFDCQPHGSDIWNSFWHFEFHNGSDVNPNDGSALALFGPLWPPLLLLLVAPVRWLIARPTNAPAFPVVTANSQKRAYERSSPTKGVRHLYF